ncbi:MAG: hypothetical protein JNK82_45385 [Myxococcaceae bacterium]|nr:hypothetical protein [Myxococcaceae bacterium]
MPRRRKNDEVLQLRARIEDLELRMKLLEARMRAGLPQARAPQREAAQRSRAVRRQRPRARCPGCLLELPPGRKGDSCVWCGFRFEAVRPVYL